MLKRATLHFVRLYLRSATDRATLDTAVADLVRAIRSGWTEKIPSHLDSPTDLELLEAVNGSLSTDPIAGIRLAAAKEADDKVQARVDQHAERMEREFADRMDKFKELLKSVGVDAGILG